MPVEPRLLGSAFRPREDEDVPRPPFTEGRGDAVVDNAITVRVVGGGLAVNVDCAHDQDDALGGFNKVTVDSHDVGEELVTHEAILMDDPRFARFAGA